MKNRRILSLIILVVMIVTALLLLNSCGKKEHSHSYSETVTAPTCTERGYTTYKCDCGDSYVDNYKDPAHTTTKKAGLAPTCTTAGYADYETCSLCNYTTYRELPALGHDFSDTVVKNPTVGEAGYKQFSCVHCSESYEEQINALSMSLPKVSDFLSVIIGSVSYTLDAGETKLSYVSEPSNLDLADGRQYSIQLDVANAELKTVDGIATGSLIINVKLLEVKIGGCESFEEVSSFNIEIYLVGENVSVSIAEDANAPEELEIEITKALVTFIGEKYFGMSYDAIVEMIYVIGEARDMLPALAKMLAALETVELPTVSEDFITNASDFFALFAEDIITESVNASGYNEYSINVAALEAFINAVDGKTLSEAIDEILGSGTGESVKSFIKKLPTLTIGEIADRAIVFAESYEVDVERVYVIVNYFISKSFGEEFHVESFLEDKYDMKVAELVAEMIGREDVTEAGAELQNNLSALVDNIFSYDIDSAYNMLMFGSVDYPVNGEIYSVLDTVKEYLAFVDESTVLKIAFDADGALKDIVAEVFGYCFSATVDDGAALRVTTPSGDGIEQITLAVFENELSFNAMLENGNLISFSARGNDYMALVTVSVNSKEYVHFELRLNEETSQLELLNLRLDGTVTEYTDVYDEYSGEYWYTEETEVEATLLSFIINHEGEGDYSFKFETYKGVEMNGTLTDGNFELDITPYEDEKGKLTVEHEEFYLNGENCDSYYAEFILGPDRLFAANLVLADGVIDNLTIATAYREYIYEEVYDPYYDEAYKERTDEYYVFEDTYIELTSNRDGENFVYNLGIISYYTDIYSDGTYETDVLEEALAVLSKTVNRNGRVEFALEIYDETGFVSGGEAAYEKTEDETGAITDGYVYVRIFEIIEDEEYDHVRFYTAANEDGFAFDIFLSDLFRPARGGNDTPSEPSYDDVDGGEDVPIPEEVIIPTITDTEPYAEETAPLIDLHIEYTTDDVCDKLVIRFFDAELTSTYSDGSIMALLTYLGKNIGDLNIGWNEEEGRAHCVLELFKYESEQVEGDDLGSVEVSVFDAIDEDYLFELYVTDNEEEQSLYFTLTYGEDVIVDLDVDSKFSLVINGYDKIWDEEADDGSYVYEYKNILNIKIEDNVLTVVTEEGSIKLIYTKVETDSETEYSSESKVEVEADIEGTHYEGYITLSENSDRLAILGDLVADGYDLLDLDLGFWTDGGVSLTLVVNDLINLDTKEGDEPIDPYLEQLIKVNLSMNSDENSVNNSLFFELSEGDVRADLNYFISVYAPDSGTGLVYELTYNINKLVLSDRTCFVEGDYDIDTGMYGPSVEYEVCEYIEGVGKLVFTMLVEE